VLKCISVRNTVLNAVLRHTREADNWAGRMNNFSILKGFKCYSNLVSLVISTKYSFHNLLGYGFKMKENHTLILAQFH